MAERAVAMGYRSLLVMIIVGKLVLGSSELENVLLLICH